MRSVACRLVCKLLSVSWLQLVQLRDRQQRCTTPRDVAGAITMNPATMCATTMVAISF